MANPAPRSSRRRTPASSGRSDDPDAFAFDLDKAADLLDEAGYTVGADGKRTMPDGSPIGKLRLAARSDSESSLDVMEFFQEWLADLDIDAEVVTFESSKLTSVILDGEFDAFEWGWYVDPDPDSMLSYMTCGQRGNWSDSWYCDEEYDALYDAQHVEMDDAARQDMVKQMQEILYRDAPYLVTAYSSIGEAFRSDRVGVLPAAARTRVGSGSSRAGRPTTSTCGRPPRPVTATGSRTPSACPPERRLGRWVGRLRRRRARHRRDGRGRRGGRAGRVAGGFVLMRRRATVDDRE